MFLFFDAVGTLLKPIPDVVSDYHRAGRAHGSQLQPAEIRQRFAALYPQHFSRDPAAELALQTSESREQSRWRALVTDLFHDVRPADALFEDLWRHFAQPASWEPYPDVEPTLRLLQAARIPWGIASNFDQRLDAIIAGIPVMREARAVVTSASAGWSKPSAEFFRFAAAQVTTPTLGAPQQLWMIGDDPSLDFAAATACGWRALHLDRDGRSDVSPWQIQSLLEVIERVKPA